MSSIISSGVMSRHRVPPVASSPVPSPHSRAVGARRATRAVGCGISARIGGHDDAPVFAGEVSERPIRIRQSSGPFSRYSHVNAPERSAANW
jgi:hypothetical protein